MGTSVIFAFSSATLALLLGLIIVFAARRTTARWAFAGGMLALGLEAIFSGAALQSTTTERMLHWRSLELVAASFYPGCWVLFSLTYARGNASEFIERWRMVVIGAFTVPLLNALVFAGDLLRPIRNGEDIQVGVFSLTPAGMFVELFLVISSVLILMNLERTFRSAVGTMRWRIKYVVLGLGLIMAVRAYTSSQSLLFRAADLAFSAIDLGALLLGCLVMVRSLLRVGHFEVTVYPSHTILQNSVTVILAGIYFLSIGMFANYVSHSGGTRAFPLKALAVLLLLVLFTMVLLSDRVRLYLRRLYARYFQRPLHDYRTVWRTFTEGTASHVEEAALSRAVAKLVSDLFQVLSVNIWLVNQESQTFSLVASTALNQQSSAFLTPAGQDADEVIRALRANPDPVDLDSSLEHWASALRRCNPGEFRKGGNRVCVPMLARGELIGFMTLGDRVGAVAFSLQDFDLLKCVADQAAASMLNISLSQQILRAKELEAFQTMSAFFVHDLKNTASTLSLMLQNLPIHFDNPAFREDALRAVGKTVNHINSLISRLSMLRQNTSLKLVPADLNQLVEEGIKCLDEVKGLQVIKDLGGVPETMLDPDQMNKLIVNLALNAREAVGAGGRIEVRTNADPSWVVLSITDNGCGMPAEFISRSLFRPFQTTKKQGIGIGMFQCKMIVEAHRGRIEVESAPGKGTTFRVLLPIQTITK